MLIRTIIQSLLNSNFIIKLTANEYSALIKNKGINLNQNDEFQMNTSFKYIQEKYDLRKHLKDLNKSKVTKKNKISMSETNTKGKKTPCLIYRVLSIKNCKNSQTKQESGYFIDNWKLSNWEKGL